MIAYSWDEVGCEALGWPMDDPPSGLADEDILLLADARIVVECGSTLGTNERQFRNEDGVLVLDARFGQDKVCRTYVCLEDDAKARALANQELDTFLEA